MTPRPLIAISAGDPAGIGPEVTVKALSEKTTYEQCKPLIVCDGAIIDQIVGILGLPVRVHKIGHPAQGIYEHGTLDVLDLANVDSQTFRFNEVSAMCGKASFEYVQKVIELALTGEVDGTVTGPIHKEALHRAGYDYAGHTEIYGALTQTRDYAMMLAEKNFRVVHVSTHVSLRQAIDRVKKDRIVRVIYLANEALLSMGIAAPRIAVAGLNPHAGENGLFGQEEMTDIIPAIEAAQQMGIQADGPHPPDTIFPKLRGGLYDIVVCMYHDQGHIPTKLLGFVFNANTKKWDSMSGVNITLGLPIIRVSVDHGVAFDKGGKGEANPESMIQALAYCTRLSLSKQHAHAH